MLLFKTFPAQPVLPTTTIQLCPLVEPRRLYEASAELDDVISGIMIARSDTVSAAVSTVCLSPAYTRRWSSDPGSLKGKAVRFSSPLSRPPHTSESR